jgi:DNA-directed RNA polymerase specialized sigma24 family protein
LARDTLPDALLNGDSAAWEGFVRRYGGLIVAAVRGLAPLPGDIEDLTQEVFVRLCKDQFRLLRSYDPARAALSTWLTIVARTG